MRLSQEPENKPEIATGLGKNTFDMKINHVNRVLKVRSHLAVDSVVNGK